MKASIVEMEGLLRGKCVPAKMLVNESLAEYLVRQFDSLHERAEVAERERDELRAEQAEHDEQIARMESKFSLAKRALDSKTARCEKAEAELSRRDAAAGEPVAVLYRNGDVLTKAECGEYFEICCKVETPLYTAAPPAVLPPEVTEPVGEYCLDDREGLAWLAGANWMRQHCLELGAQQQKVVELPDFSESYTEVFALEITHALTTALDAAGVKWEAQK